jgi:hypothetical protein
MKTDRRFAFERDLLFFRKVPGCPSDMTSRFTQPFLSCRVHKAVCFIGEFSRPIFLLLSFLAEALY